MSDLDIKVDVAVLENRVDTIEVMQKETHTMVFDIKSRLDKQNGLLPHMAQDIKDMASEIKSVADALALKTSNIADALAAKTIEDTRNNIKFNMLWSAITVLASAVVTGLIIYFFKSKI